MSDLICPLCRSIKVTPILDLGNMPLVNSIDDTKNKYPLNLYQCSDCDLVFVNTPKTADHIYSNYTYFSSWSDSWLKHCKSLFQSLLKNNYIIKKSKVLEIASNDGYMLRNFKDAGFNDIIGVEPAINIAASANKSGISTINAFFTTETARKLKEKGERDCIIALNVLAHVPDINDFINGIKVILAPKGIVVLEFHHLLSLLKLQQYDTIYHEHFSYLSLRTVVNAFKNINLRVFDAEKISTQGGSLRILVSHNNQLSVKKFPLKNNVNSIIDEESAFGISSVSILKSFADSVYKNIRIASDYITNLKASGVRICGYGAAAKAVIFINATGLDSDVIDCIADINPVKQGRLIPGTSIPIVSPLELSESKPDCVIIFPWNLRQEIIKTLKESLTAGTKYLIFAPEPEMFE